MDNKLLLQKCQWYKRKTSRLGRFISFLSSYVCAGAPGTWIERGYLWTGLISSTCHPLLSVEHFTLSCRFIRECEHLSALYAPPSNCSIVELHKKRLRITDWTQ